MRQIVQRRVNASRKMPSNQLSRDFSLMMHISSHKKTLLSLDENFQHFVALRGKECRELLQVDESLAIERHKGAYVPICDEEGTSWIWLRHA
jgi:hypothetical protein